MSKKADIGLIGLAVMGENLVLNMERNGFTVAVFNRTVEKVDNFVNGRGAGKNFIACHSLAELAANLERPRRIMMMIKAGSAVDSMIDQLVPVLEEGDIIIDGGNSFYQDTIRRTKDLAAKGIRYIGTGVSGGEEGALKGPSIMPGGNPEAWPYVKPVFQAIAAKVVGNFPCCQWVGDNGAGHYVKMVHNGIEYGDMQMICEAYWLLKNILGLNADELHEVFADWNKGELNSYLIEITSEIFTKKDPETGKPVADIILDVAGQKGTGKWTSQGALDLGAPAPTVAEAVFSRCLSAVKEERVAASKVIKCPATAKFTGDKKEFIEAVRQALYASKICSYAQGFQMLQLAAKEYNWDLHYGEIALLWRGGCIIRATFLEKIKEAFDKDANLANLLVDDFFNGAVAKCADNWRKVVSQAVLSGVPVPAFSSALAYYDGYRSACLPANLLQAQRDYFGAHTYERVDKPRGQFFHTEWTEDCDHTVAGTYNS
ncbi:MAG: decarboxylating NADP(+)-dependent phosphogluconate dehydrogenase [Lentisphaeria bacterium]|nr:decarboxylating NADP(+)-dependent phosphogluconate dehydrogenase [Lentisphaeria bacterium]